MASLCAILFSRSSVFVHIGSILWLKKKILHLNAITWYTYLVYLVIKLTHYRSALNFCFIEAIDWSFTVVSCRLFHVSTTRFEKKFFLMSVRLYCFINFWEWPRNSRAGCLKYMLAGVLYWLWTNLYVSTQSVNFLLLSSESNSISFEQSWRHFLCTFSNLSMSCLYHGFHTGDAYSRAGLIIDWYNVVTFFSVKFVKHRFIIPIFWYAFFVIISMCVAGLRVLDIVTPRSFWLSTLSRLTFFSE